MPPPLDSHAVLPARAEIERVQLEKLRRLVALVIRDNPFYAAKLARRPPELSDLSMANFARDFPFTYKHELVEDQNRFPPFGTNLTFPLASYTRCHQTSGSKGSPLRWLDTPETWQHLVQNWHEIYRAAGVTSQDRFLFAFSFGPFLGFWSAMEAAVQTPCFCFPGGSMSSPARLQALLELNLTVLACTPTYALHLGEVARKQRVDVSRAALRLIIVAGEPGGSIPSVRARLAALWPTARVFDHHGMTEVGPVTHECPAQPGVLHVLESAYLPEIIDPVTRRPLAPGQSGELVLTTLDRLGSPLLRYRTGDLVRARAAAGPCACGHHTLALEGGILGRSDDMVVIRGVNVYPSAVEEIIRGCGHNGEYRVILDRRTAMPELSVDLEPDVEDPEASSLTERVGRALQDALNLRIPVRLVPPDTLPRFEMKSWRWLRIET
jgi:phenylacetate-CoA ligase